MLAELVGLGALIEACAPDVAPRTMAAIVQVESANNVYAIGVNSAARLARQPVNRQEAVATARRLLAEGRNIDLGLGQINSNNMQWLGLSVEDAFDPCKNLTAAARVLTTNYRSVQARSPSPQHALRTALSMYNSGSETRGFANGYVRRIEIAAGTYRPAQLTISNGEPGLIQVVDTTPSPTARDVAAVNQGQVVAIEAATPKPPPPEWDVFGRSGRSTLMVFGSSE